MDKTMVNSSLSKRSTKNASTGAFFFMLRTIIGFILSPIFVNYLGSSYFGIWKSIERFLGFASINDGGTQALKWTIANQELSNDFSKKKREVASALIVWFIFLPIIIIIIGLLSYYSPYLINNVNPNDFELVRVIALIFGINIIITPLFGISESVIIGVNQGFIVNYIKIFWFVIGSILMYSVVVLDFGLVGFAYVIILLTSIRGLNYFITCKRRISWFGVLMPKKDEINFFIKFSSWKLVWVFVSRFIMSSEIIFLGFLIGASSVSQFVFTNYISNIGITITAIISSSITPGLGRLIGNREYKKGQKIIDQLRELLLTIGLLVSAGMLLLNKSFVLLWVGPDLFVGTFNNILIAILMIQLIIIRNESFLIDLGLNIRTNVLIGIVSIGLTTLFSFIGYTFVSESMSSILVGIFFGRLIMFLTYPFLTNKLLFLPGRLSFPYKLIFGSLLFLIITMILGSVQVFVTWTNLILMGIIELLICVLFLYKVILGIDNQIYVKKIFMNIRNRIWQLF